MRENEQPPDTGSFTRQMHRRDLDTQCELEQGEGWRDGGREGYSITYFGGPRLEAVGIATDEESHFPKRKGKVFVFFPRAEKGKAPRTDCTLPGSRQGGAAAE